MKVCPNNALQPTLEQAGIEGLWTPTLVPRIGYCEPSCVLCSEVCPTGAIWQITPKEKGWVVGSRRHAPSQPVRWAQRFTIAAAACRGPWPPIALCARSGARFRPRRFMSKRRQVVDSAGKPKTLKQPRVDPSRCVGCGACEYACPLQERPAVYVTSIGESRSPSSQILLTRK